MTQEQSLAIIAWCQLLGVIGMIGAVIILLAIKKVISTKLDEINSKVGPMAQQVTEIAKQTKDATQSIAGKIGSIATHAENTTAKVGNTVQSLTSKVEKAISPKVAATIGLAGAAFKLYEMYTNLVRGRKSKGK